MGLGAAESIDAGGTLLGGAALAGGLTLGAHLLNSLALQQSGGQPASRPLPPAPQR